MRALRMGASPICIQQPTGTKALDICEVPGKDFVRPAGCLFEPEKKASAKCAFGRILGNDQERWVDFVFGSGRDSEN